MEKLRKAITGVLADPYFAIPSEEAKVCLEGARNIIQAFTETTELQKNFSAWLVKSLTAIVNSLQNSAQQSNKENLWIRFHELTVSVEFVKMWETFASELGIGTLSPLLYQHITDVIFERIIKESVTSVSTVACTSSTPSGDAQVPGLTFEEECAIHYVGGYVIRELKLDKANVEMLPLLELLTYSDSPAGGDDDPM